MMMSLRWRWLVAASAVWISLILAACGDDDSGGGVARFCRGLCDTADCSCIAVVGEKVDLPSPAEPADTPGSPGVTVDPSSKLAVQFGGTSVDLNNARYTRYHADARGLQPDAVLILVPGFEGGASDFQRLAEQLLPRALRDNDLLLEVWAYDRRTDQLEDRAGLILAEQRSDAQMALDWLFGEELELTLHPELNRRAVIYNSRDDIPFLANWTPLVFSQDIDVVVDAARAATRTDNVFLGGHSAGTGFAARYAATDFDLTGAGPPRPGYAKLKGLVLLEGGGGTTAGAPPNAEILDLIEARFDGGLYGAVRDGEPRCADGLTACTAASEDADCAHLSNTECVESTLAYAEVPGLLNTRVLASIEPAAIQGRTDPDSGPIILQVEQNGVPLNTAVLRVPDLAGLTFLPQGTVMGGVGAFVDDDGFVASFAAFVAMSVGLRGPTVDGLQTWLDITEEVPPQAFSDNGPPPKLLPARPWGIEKEPVRFDRLLELFIGETNFLDWYFPSSGLSVTAGLPSLDSSALSLDPPLGRGRREIENLTQAANIDIPVICFGGSNGLTTAPGAFAGFGNSIGVCRAPSCDGTTPRVVDGANPDPAFPTLGGPPGGFEAYISEGYAHVDIVVAEDGEGNEVIGRLAEFLARNTER
jgi:pimeloyl-ACP methyl ester carboxylesterase